MSRKTLIVRLRNYVGDVVLSVPALELIAAQGYDLQIVAKPWAASLLSAYPWTVTARAAKPLARVAQLRRLRRAAVAADPGFDRRENMLVFPNAFSGGIEPWLAGLKAVANDLDGRRLLLARAVEPVWGHALVHIWGLAGRFLKLDLPAPARIALATRDVDQQRADELLRAQGVRPGFIVLCPFAAGVFEDQDKTWPAFPEFARALAACGRDLVCCPGPGESAPAAQRYPGVRRLEGVDLGVYGGVMRRAALVVANDTGPGHLAAAVGAPTLSVLGPTAPDQWAPWGPTVRVLREWPRWPTIDEALAATGLAPAVAAAPAPGSGARTARPPAGSVTLPSPSVTTAAA